MQNHKHNRLPHARQMVTNSTAFVRGYTRSKAVLRISLYKTLPTVLYRKALQLIFAVLDSTKWLIHPWIVNSAMYFCLLFCCFALVHRPRPTQFNTLNMRLLQPGICRTVSVFTCDFCWFSLPHRPIRLYRYKAKTHING